MTPEELKVLQEKVGNDATAAIKKELDAYDTKAKKFAEEAAKGKISEETFKEFKEATDTALAAAKEIAEKQGTTLTELANKINTHNGATKSIAQVLKDDESELKEVFKSRNTRKSYMVNVNEKGEFVMRPFDETVKAAGPTAASADVGGAGNTASILQSIDSSSLLRLGGDSAIISQYRNSKWIFDLVNLINAGSDTMMAMWYEEQAKQGGPADVAEGGTKPLSQYAYELKSSTYKKKATMIGFTEEWALDFARLQSDILGKGRTDLINAINTDVLSRIITAATAYNSGTAYKTAYGGAGVGGAISTNYNDYIGIDAMAAQVDNDTFGQKANAAIMSTFKNHALNAQMDTQGRFLMPPPLLQSLAFVGNPAMATDDVLVGDLKQYNVILRGGLIVRVGYNGNDFANNMFSVVLEQFYFDYISAIRAKAIVKGQTFATVKTALTS
jgi:hypothetical protein